jgi:CRISPR-associated protein Csb1
VDYRRLKAAIAGKAVGIRSKVRLVPFGGPYEKVFPATYREGNVGPYEKVFPATYREGNVACYATEKRRVNGAEVECVLLDSVASQANRRELALLRAARRGEIEVPLVTVDFSGSAVAYLGSISSLEAPHRIFDALLRDACLGDVAFKDSPVGREIAEATINNAVAMLRYAPTTLLNGGWNSTWGMGTRGARFERAITGEIIGINATYGSKTSSRLDPAGIEAKVSIYKKNGGGWTPVLEEAVQEKGKPVFFGKNDQTDKGRPSLINHGNVLPALEKSTGGVTIDYAEASTVISFPALRRLGFPCDKEGRSFDPPKVAAAEAAAHAALAALGMTSSVLALNDGFDLRSRCFLVAEGGCEDMTFEMLSRNGDSEEFRLTDQAAKAMLEESIAEVRAAGLAWEKKEQKLVPLPQLVELIKLSHEEANEPEAVEG